MLKRCLFLPGLMVAAAASAQVASAPAPSLQVQLANLQEDVRGLTQRVNDLSLEVEQIDHDRTQPPAQAASAERDAVTVAQLNQAVADLNRAIHSAVADSKAETLQRIGDQMEKLARQTNAALDSLARGGAAGPADQPAVLASGPGPGKTYLVQGGDTLASISKKTGARISDIIEANKIADPSRILAGQTLVIPAPVEK
jgi:LysM repeat protein